MCLSSFHRLQFSAALVVLAVVAGCDPLQSKSNPVIKASDDISRAGNALADVLASIRDEESATAAMPKLKTASAEFCKALSTGAEVFPSHEGDVVLKTVLEETKDRLKTAMDRCASELDRVSGSAGLSGKAWHPLRTVILEITVASLDFAQRLGYPAPTALIADLAALHQLASEFGAARCITLRVQNAADEDSEKIEEQIHAVVPGAKIVRANSKDFEGYYVFVAPVEHFEIFVRSLELGRVVQRDDTSRLLVISADPDKLGKPNAAAMAQAQAESLKKLHPNAWDRLNPPKPDDPDYFEKMLERLESTDHWARGEAAKTLATADPTKVKNPETKKQIARTFHKLAFEQNSWHQGEAIRGLYTWGGKHAVPLLLDLYPTVHGDSRNLILEVLAESKDERAAPILAESLKSRFNHGKATGLLIKMGNAAESAVLDIVNSPDPDVCMACVEVLGQIGTEKSVPKLRRASQSKNEQVREAAKTSLQLVRERIKASKQNGASGPSDR
jgi:HEAT repeat protein